MSTGFVKAFINMSQMTVSQMSITETTPSPQHKLHWLAEQALNWSGLPVVHVRPTVLLEGFFLILTPDSVEESNQIRLPFGEVKTSPVAVENVAHVMAELLTNPQPHIGNASMHRNIRKRLAARSPFRTFRSSLAGRAAQARLAASLGEPPHDDGRSAPRGALRPDVERRAQANVARAAERAGVRQEECGDIHRVGKRGLSVCGCSHSTNLTFDFLLRKFIV